jgi:predicted RNA-binding protein with PIN domain
VPILIDGHNLIGRLRSVSLADPEDEARLVEMLRAYRARTGARITVVFDPGVLYAPPQTYTQGGLQVVFAPHGGSADAVLLRRLRRHTNPRGLTVVSSDRAIVRAAQDIGARVVTAQAFAELLENPPLPEAEPQDVQLSPAEVEAWLALFEGQEEGDSET